MHCICMYCNSNNKTPVEYLVDHTLYDYKSIMIINQ